MTVIQIRQEPRLKPCYGMVCSRDHKECACYALVEFSNERPMGTCSNGEHFIPLERVEAVAA